MMTTRKGVWKKAMSDALIHPVKSWGLDSFRNQTKMKKHIYVMNVTKNKEGQIIHADIWDNPHNLYVSLLFEWGIISLFILGGLLRYYAIRFNRCVKSPNVVGLAGFLIVLLIVSIGQFPLFLARLACFIVPAAALFEITTE